MSYTSTAYINVSDILERGDVKPPVPTVGRRSDGTGLFYREQANLVFGDPESGKTLIAQCAAADEMSMGRAALIIDLDHNGAAATISRLVSMGVDEAVLRDPDLFRYCQPEDADHLAVVVKEAVEWKPAIILLDSLGELLPMFGASSNSPDDFTRVHAAVIKPLTKSGAAVLVIDHLPKNRDSQSFGSTGTTAKKRAIGGTSLRVTVQEPFRPGIGGRAQVTLNKDRHGGLRAACPTEDREPLAATFKLWNENGDILWRFIPPALGERPLAAGFVEQDVIELSELMPAPTSQRDIKERLGWGSTRAMDALREWRRRGQPTTVLPAPAPYVSGAQEHSVTAPRSDIGAQEHSNDGAPRSPHIGVREQGALANPMNGEAA
ncbi:AAA family ATPase [Microbacterium sp. SS28]|uniref:AAA family ATPase n=1 Tax=Microbacterium sp. SS28 TaxID=2919948 RepID=UPI001FAAD186|nr:AAA family ATPase [Microbacterium sp. SS28]